MKRTIGPGRQGVVPGMLPIGTLTKTLSSFGIDRVDRIDYQIMWNLFDSVILVWEVIPDKGSFIFRDKKLPFVASVETKINKQYRA